ncbi:hypothetical protein WDA48_02305, partial [Acinetobacter pittii]
TTYPSYALNLAQLGALCLSNLCATKPFLIGFLKPSTLISPYNPIVMNISMISLSIIYLLLLKEQTTHFHKAAQ